MKNGLHYISISVSGRLKMKNIRCAKEKVPKRLVVSLRALGFHLGAKKDEYQINATIVI